MKWGKVGNFGKIGWGRGKIGEADHDKGRSSGEVSQGKTRRDSTIKKAWLLCFLVNTNTQLMQKDVWRSRRNFARRWIAVRLLARAWEPVYRRIRWSAGRRSRGIWWRACQVTNCETLSDAFILAPAKLS